MSPTRELLDLDEADIAAKISFLKDKAHAAVSLSMQALMDRDVDAAQRVIDGDAGLNALQANIERECLSTIATQQPVASDLRAIISDLQIAQELERIADHASAIAHSVMRLDADVETEVPASLLKMSEDACAMLDKSMSAYQQGDAQLARELAKDDDALDRMQETMTNDIIQLMTDRRIPIVIGSQLLWIIHNLERIGDLSTNIGERVIYICSGETLDLNREL